MLLCLIHKFYFAQSNLLPMLLPLILMVSKCFQLMRDLSTFPNKANPTFSNGPQNLPKNLPHCPILCKWIFDNFILAEKLFSKALRSLESCVLVNDIYMENQSHHQNHQQHLMKVLKLLQYYFLFHNLHLLSYQLDSFVILF